MEASKCLIEINRLHDQVAVEWIRHPNIRAPRTDPSLIEFDLDEFMQEEPILIAEIRHRTSEFLLHVRSALDYIAYAIVWFDQGEVKESSKFPLVANQGRWSSNRRTGVPGVSSKHLSWIHAVQPFMGVSWTRNLVTLSNHDKHRRLVQVVPIYSFSIDINAGYADPLGDMAYIGYQIKDPSLDLSIIVPGHGDAGSEEPLLLDETLSEVLKGAVNLANLFLNEFGPSTLKIDEMTEIT